MKNYYNVPVIFNDTALAFFGMALYGNDKQDVPEWMVIHESVHEKQSKEVGGWIVFYIIYGYQYLLNLFKTMSFTGAYYAIPFEVEAYIMAKVLAAEYEKDYYHMSLDQFIELKLA